MSANFCMLANVYSIQTRACPKYSVCVLWTNSICRPKAWEKGRVPGLASYLLNQTLHFMEMIRFSICMFKIKKDKVSIYFELPPHSHAIRDLLRKYVMHRTWVSWELQKLLKLTCLRLLLSFLWCWVSAFRGLLSLCNLLHLFSGFWVMMSLDYKQQTNEPMPFSQAVSAGGVYREPAIFNKSEHD